MLRRLPPLNALKAFEAAARHESFTRAAEELCVTQGAVSHQVKALEAGIGIKLFNRERQRLMITEAGREYLAVVRDALDRIALGTEHLIQRQNSGALKRRPRCGPRPNGRAQRCPCPSCPRAGYELIEGHRCASTAASSSHSIFAAVGARQPTSRARVLEVRI